MKAFNIALASLFVLLAACGIIRAQSNDAAAAWKEVQQAAIQPRMPWDLARQQPTLGQLGQYFQQVADAAMAAAEKANAFYTQFPSSTNALPARLLECKLLESAFRDGVAIDGKRGPAYAAWQKAQDALLAEPRLTADQRFNLRAQILVRKLLFDWQTDWNTRYAEYEKGLRQLIKDYPKNDSAYELLLNFARISRPDKARAIANEILAGPASPSVKAQTHSFLIHLDKPAPGSFSGLSPLDLLLGP